MEIWKYRVQNSIAMPINAKILTLQEQDNQPHIWVLVDSKSEKEFRYFRFFATGETVDVRCYSYIGTWLPSDFLVWHLFERRTNEGE